MISKFLRDWSLLMNCLLRSFIIGFVISIIVLLQQEFFHILLFGFLLFAISFILRRSYYIRFIDDVRSERFFTDRMIFTNKLSLIFLSTFELVFIPIVALVMLAILCPECPNPQYLDFLVGSVTFISYVLTIVIFILVYSKKKNLHEATLFSYLSIDVLTVFFAAVFVSFIVFHISVLFNPRYTLFYKTIGLQLCLRVCLYLSFLQPPFLSSLLKIFLFFNFFLWFYFSASTFKILSTTI